MPKAIVVSTGLIWALLISSAGPATSAQDDPPIPFVTVASGRSTGILQPVREVIRDADAWRALWRRHAGPGAAVPAVDFAREMAVAVFAGASATPRTVTIARITREADRLTVWYVLRETPLTDSAGLRPMAAFHIVRLARSSLPVTFSLLKSFPVVPNP